MGQNTNKFVFVKEVDGIITLHVSITECLKAGGEFTLFSKDTRNVLGKWKVSIGASGHTEVPIKVPLHNMQFSVLVWQLLTCSTNPALDDGAIRIEFSQGNKTCKQSVLTEANLTNIAPCIFRHPTSYKDAITFVIKKDLPKE